MFKKVRLFTLFILSTVILSTVLTLTIIYNSCTFQNVKFSKILSSFLQDFRVEIKNGDYSTKTLENIPLNFKVPTKNLRSEVIDYEMKISQTPDCSSGEWEPYQKETTWNFQSNEEEEKLLFIYVKFRERRAKEINYTFEIKDFEETQGESKCIYDSIVHDTIAPRNLKLSYKPAKRTSQKKAEFRFTAEDYSLIHFECQLKKSELNPSLTNPEEALWASCAPGINYNSSNFRQEGDYTFFLRAKDLSGNTSNILEYTWTIDSMAPSLRFSSCPQDVYFSSSTQISSISVESDNLTFPVTLYCKNNRGQFESCGTIRSSQTPATINPIHFIKEESTNTHYKKTLNVKGLVDATLGNFSEPIECSWYVDIETTPPRIEFVTSPIRSYGTSTDPYFHPDPFKIRIYDNRFQTQQSHLGKKIKYRVYTGNNNNTLLTSTCNNLIDNWCELPLDQNIERVHTDSNNNYAETKPIHITQGLRPGINMANEHRIEIQFEDTTGRTSATIEHTWDVYGQVEELSTIQSISGTSEGKADILFVLDDSGSMRDESTELGASFSGIIDSLGSLNWRIAVTTMEQRHTKFGKLVQLISNTSNTFLEGQYILSSQETCSPPLYCSSDKSELEAIFKRTITKGRRGVNNFTFTGDTEYGIQSVHALLDYFNNNPISATITSLPSSRNRNADDLRAIRLFLRRGDSTFVVIFITDEGNCNNRTNTSCHINNMNKPQNLINKVRTIFGDDKKFISYPIIPVRGKGYDNYPGPYTVKDDYLELAKTTQRRQSESGNDQVIWVDVNPNVDDMLIPSINGPIIVEGRRSLNTTCPNSIPRDAGVYTKDLCTISKDILEVTSRTIQLNCTPIRGTPTTGIHPPKYSYSSTLNAPSNDPTFTPLNTNTNGVVLIENGNRVILDGQPTQGTYKVEYFCYSDQIRLPTN